MHNNQKGLIIFQRTPQKWLFLFWALTWTVKCIIFFFLYVGEREEIWKWRKELWAIGLENSVRGVERRSPKQKNIWNVLWTLLVMMWQGWYSECPRLTWEMSFLLLCVSYIILDFEVERERGKRKLLPQSEETFSNFMLFKGLVCTVQKASLVLCNSDVNGFHSR